MPITEITTPGPRRTRTRRACHPAGWLLVALVLASQWLPTPVSGQERQKQVLVLYSVRRDAQIAVVGDRELPRMLQADLPAGVDYYSEFMDAARLPETDYEEAFRDFLDLKYQGHRFDVVIAMGEVPLAFLGRHREALFGNTPIVFFASGPIGERPPNSTGVVARLDLAATLELAARLQPDLRTIFVISGSGGSQTEQDARAQFAGFEPRLTITYLAGLATRDLDARLAGLPGRSAVYYLVVDRDGDSQNFHPLEYLDRVTRLSNAPVYSWVDSAMGHGIVGGSLKDQAKEVEAVGSLALRVLRGELADTIPLTSPNLNVAQVDWRQLQRWGLSEARLPPGTLVAFRQPSTWDRYRGLVIGAFTLILAQSALIGALLVQRRRRQLAEDQVRRGEAALRASFERIRDLGGRLLRAQDSERSRLARELHDDISQQLALLQIDVELLGRTAGNADVTGEALERARSVARSVHDLSHRLHPAKLRLIGLVPALKGLQRELSQAGVPISFTHDGIPARVPPDVTLCLFRVAQEALQNAIKHSGAQNAAIHLSGTSEQIALSVADDGAGFDVGQTWGRGLGLISMEERVEAAGGQFELASSEEAGTRISVTVPLRAESA